MLPPLTDTAATRVQSARWTGEAIAGCQYQIRLLSRQWHPAVGRDGAIRAVDAQTGDVASDAQLLDRYLVRLDVRVNSMAAAGQQWL